MVPYLSTLTRFIPEIYRILLPHCWIPRSAANQIRARKALKVRQPIRIECYVTRVGSYSQLTIKSRESSRISWRSVFESRLESACCSLSQYKGTSALFLHRIDSNIYYYGHKKPVHCKGDDSNVNQP